MQKKQLVILIMRSNDGVEEEDGEDDDGRDYYQHLLISSYGPSPVNFLSHLIPTRSLRNRYCHRPIIHVRKQKTRC